MNKSSSDIRKKFLDFFAKNGHKVVPSDSLIPSGDPSLLFTSAGMVQFKKNFLGQTRDEYTRASSCQKCFRTSDINNIGNTNRHLTFFEMLGNFSFGDYFKNEAIAWSWEFITQQMALPKEKLYVTIFKNDDEAFEIWKKLLPESKIIRMDENTNFWNMGPTGPCGPCSEIIMDLGAAAGCKKPDCNVGCDCDRYLEIWNLVFTQFNRQEDGRLINLPRKNIDTGMGLERLVSAVNSKESIFETDLFLPIIKSLTKILEVKYADNKHKLNMMADHIRAITFLISDGVLPSNDGRGYVLRRIMRRALRQGKLLGMNKPFLYKITSDVVSIMKSAYPELAQRKGNIATIIKMEENKFLDTLESGMKILDDIIIRYESDKIIPGIEVFKLYDTYGFPPDLTKEIALEKNLKIDEIGFKEAQKKAQEQSRAAWNGSGETDITFYSKLYKELGDILFEGYENLILAGKIIGLIKNGSIVKELNEQEEGEIILNKTPFYAESGGQIGDRGEIVLRDSRSEELAVAEVMDTRKPIEGLIVHKVRIIKGKFNTDDVVEASVNQARRYNIMRHHTATHLLHKALREVLGSHVTQAGSLVTANYLRFDFTHFEAMKPEEIKSAEEIVNKAIRDNMPVFISNMKLEEARKQGAMALFGEKYGSDVRAISVLEHSDSKTFSMELCGGTHVAKTGDIGMFKIISESSIASGTRRIEAVVGEATEKYIQRIEQNLEDIAYKLKVPKNEVSTRIDRLLLQQKELEKEVNKLKSQILTGGISDIVKNVKEIKGVKVLAEKVSDIDLNSLRGLADNLRSKMGSCIIILANAQNEKVSFIVTVTQDLVKSGYNAGKIAKNFACSIGGSGGGKPDFAQGGGKDISLLDTALNKITDFI